MLGAVLEPDLLEQVPCLLFPLRRGDPRELHGKGHVLECSHAWDEIEGLENESHGPAAEECQRILVHFVQPRPVHSDLA